MQKDDLHDLSDFISISKKLRSHSKYSESLSLLNKALILYPNSPDLFFQKGFTLYYLQDFPGAIECYQNCLKLNPKHSDVFVNMGVALKESGKIKEAIEAYKKAIELNSDDEKAYVNLGVAQKSLKLFEEAISSYDKAIEIKKENFPAYLNKGYALESLGRYDEAIAAFYKAIEIKPENAIAYNSIGSPLESLGRFEDAVEAYNAAIQMDPKLAAAYLNKGICLKNLQRYPEALELFDKALSIKIDYSSAYYNKGITLRCMGKYADAIENYDLALKYNPNDAATFNNKGICFKHLFKPEEAVAEFEKAIALKPHRPLYYCNIAQSLLQLGRDREALDHLNSAYDLFAEDQTEGLTSGNIEFIMESFENDRKELIGKLFKIQKQISRIDFDLEINEDSPRARTFSLKTKEQIQPELNKCLDLLMQEPSKDINKELAARLQQLEAQIKQYHDEQEKIKHVMEDAGVYDKAEIKQEFDAFENENPKLYDYCKTFYWTLLNYFGAYRALSTGLIQGKLKATTKDNTIVAGIKGIAKLAGQIASSVPFVGGIVHAIDGLVDYGKSDTLQRQLENKTNVITQLIIDATLDDAELSLRVGKAAILLTKTRREQILNGKEPVKMTEKAKTGMRRLTEKINFIVSELKQKAVEVKTLYDSEEKKLALQDVTLFLAYIFRNYKYLSHGMKLEERVVGIVAGDSINEVFEEIASETMRDKHKKDGYSLF